VIRRCEAAAADAAELLNRVLVAARRGGAVIHDQRPSQRARGQRSVLGIVRTAGERDLLTDTPFHGWRRRVDDRGRRCVAGMNGERRRVAETAGVGHT
jgi:hypothetical protein